MSPIRQAGVFLAILFGVTWTLGVLLRPPATPQNVWEVLAPLFPTVWAPTIIALALVRLTQGARGVRAEIKARLSYSNWAARWLVLAGVVPVLAHFIAVVIARGAGEGAPFIPTAALPMMIGLQLVTGAVGEELGWRGFLLPRLGQRFGERGAAWTMALLWSLWHVPAYFTPGMPHQLMPMLPSLLSVALFGVFLAFVFNRAGQSVLTTIAAHLSLNVMLGAGGMRLSSASFWWALAGVFGAVAVFTTIQSRLWRVRDAPLTATPSS
jgi:uncharacterized protein